MLIDVTFVIFIILIVQYDEKIIYFKDSLNFIY